MTRPGGSLSLLTELMDDAIRSDYVTVNSAPNSRRPGRVVLVLAGLVGVAAGLVLAGAGVATRSAEPTLAAQRAALLASIDRVTAETAATEAAVVVATARVADLEEQILGDTGIARDLAARTEAAADLAGYEPLTGPGVAVTMNDSPDGDRLGRVMDRDLQVLVNGLWRAGAEGVAVNGLRLTARTAIRTAGEAILVDYRPLAPPYRVEAVGPDLAAGLQTTGTAALLDDLATTYGLEWDVTTVDEIRLPAARSALPTVPDPAPEAIP